jgi:Zn-dependent M28 family amino/carboxypeptidase
VKTFRLLRPAAIFAIVGACAAIAVQPASAVDLAAPAVDAAQLLGDVRALAAPEFGGRKTGTEGSLKAQDYLQKRFEAIGLQAYPGGFRQPFSFTRTSARGQATPTRIEFPSAVNLIGFIPGSKHPARVMVVSAHYDHLGARDSAVYFGADDNASGVGALLAIAAHFKASPPENTIVFAAFDGEEQGLQGAKAFLARLPFPREQLAFNLNLDMVSHNDENTIFAAGTSHTPSLKALVGQVAKRSTVQVKLGHDLPLPGAPASDDWTSSSDHGPFHEAGLPFLYFGVEDHPDYHKPTDTFERINQGFYVKVAGLLIDMAATLDRNLDSVPKARN